MVELRLLKDRVELGLVARYSGRPTLELVEVLNNEELVGVKYARADSVVVVALVEEFWQLDLLNLAVTFKILALE